MRYRSPRGGSLLERGNVGLRKGQPDYYWFQVVSILASSGPVTPSGSFASPARRPWLNVGSGWFPIEDELNIGSELLLAVARGNILCNLELMTHSRHWQGERLEDPFPSDVRRGCVIIGKPSVARQFFDKPVKVLAAESKTRVRIVLSDETPAELVALSDDCVARLGRGHLLGFDLRRFTRK